MKPKKHYWDNAWEKNESEGRWDHAYWKNVSPEIVRLIRSESPAKRPRVLDLGCGLGRNAIAFAKAGFTVTAVDISREAVSHLKAWEKDENLQIPALISDFTADVFSADSFDMVISLNVIYHGYRQQAAQAITNIRKWLRLGGIFYLTFPTREDGDYGNGRKLADHTFEIDPGHLHYNADETDLRTLLAGFEILNLNKEERPWRNDKSRFNSRWHVLAEKIDGHLESKLDFQRNHHNLSP